VTLTVTLELSDDLAERLSAVATARGVTVEKLALEVIEARYPGAPPVSFLGVGTPVREPAARKDQDLVRQPFLDRTPHDV
jgi:hypothetical protein